MISSSEDITFVLSRGIQNIYSSVPFSCWLYLDGDRTPSAGDLFNLMKHNCVHFAITGENSRKLQDMVDDVAISERFSPSPLTTTHNDGLEHASWEFFWIAYPTISITKRVVIAMSDTLIKEVSIIARISHSLEKFLASDGKPPDDPL